MLNSPFCLLPAGPKGSISCDGVCCPAGVSCYGPSGDYQCDCASPEPLSLASQQIRGSCLLQWATARERKALLSHHSTEHVSSSGTRLQCVGCLRHIE